MDYSKLSDFEINCEVSKLTRDNANNPDSGYLVINDYCNNPADAWPIIVDNLLRMTPVVHHGSVSWIACRGDYGVSHEKPLRAAMIVFLKMQESANVQANPARPDIR